LSCSISLVTVINRGRIIVDDNELHAERGSGEFLPCASPEAAQPLGRPAAEIARLTAFGDDAIF
jgi:dihydropyrimidinase